MNDRNIDARESQFKSTVVDELVSSITNLWLDGKALLIVGDRGTGKDSVVRRLSATWGITNIQRVDCAQDAYSLRRRLEGYIDPFRAETAYDLEDATVHGAIEDANEGILYLDRIDFAHYDCLETLLSVLDNRPFTRLGDTQLTYPIDVKVVASCAPHPFLSIPTAHLHERLQSAFGNRMVVIPPLSRRTDEILPALVWFLLHEDSSFDFAGQDQLDSTWHTVLANHSWTSGFYDLKALAHSLVQVRKSGAQLDIYHLQKCLDELVRSKASSTEYALRARCDSHANALMYHGTIVDPNRLFEWIQQFTPYSSSGSVDPRYFAEELIRVIKSHYYYGNQRLKEILLEQWRKIGELISRDPNLNIRFLDAYCARDVIVTSPLGPMKSPSLMQHLLRECGLLSHRNGCEFAELATRLGTASKPTIVLFVDDFAGTGRQFKRNVIDSLSSNEAIEEAISRHPDTLFVAVICVAYKNSLLKIGTGLNVASEWVRSRFYLLVGDLLGETDQAFHETSCIFPDEPARKTAFNIIVETIGKRLYPDWPDGVGHLQSLVTFEHNMPNNSLPILWKESSSLLPWQPIFPRNR